VIDRTGVAKPAPRQPPDLNVQIAELCRLAGTLSLRTLAFVDIRYTRRYGWRVSVEVQPPRRKDRWAVSNWHHTLPDAVANVRTQVDQLITEKKAADANATEGT